MRQLWSNREIRARKDNADEGNARVPGGSASAATAAEKDLLCAFAVEADVEERVSTR